jgi:hypothetical protein
MAFSLWGIWGVRVRELVLGAAALAFACSSAVAQGSAATPVSLEPNLASSTCAAFGVTDDNYRRASLAPGKDLRTRALCGEALELYSMYKRAVAQGHPQPWRTYDAHRQASAQLTGFARESSAAPREGIAPGTRTAARSETVRRKPVLEAMADAPRLPPKAPPKREWERKYDAELADYERKMKAVRDAEESYRSGLAAVEEAKTRNASTTRAALDEFERERAAHAAAVAESERKQQAYREEYKRVTGRYPGE